MIILGQRFRKICLLWLTPGAFQHIFHINEVTRPIYSSILYVELKVDKRRKQCENHEIWEHTEYVYPLAWLVDICIDLKLSALYRRVFCLITFSEINMNSPLWLSYRAVLSSWRLDHSIILLHFLLSLYFYDLCLFTVQPGRDFIDGNTPYKLYNYYHIHYHF